MNSRNENPSESESAILNELKEKDFTIDSVYFNTDENGNSFPAVFLKKVTSFDEETLPVIADIHRKIWNYKKVLFLYVYSETEIRIYNCSEKPLIKTKERFDYEKELKNIEIGTYIFSDRNQLQELNKLFSRIAIDTGIIWTSEEAVSIRLKINLQRRVDKYLVSSLVNTASKLKGDGLKLDLIHKIILRSLFLLYLEDRGATDKNFYCQFLDGAESYFDILNDVDATYDLYKRLKEHFNGNVFTLDSNEEKLNEEQLQNIKTCFIRGREKNDTQQLFEDWRIFRLFNFKIIQIELLSEIYENFLSETDPTLKEDSGTYYTPPSLVEFILNEKLPVNKEEYNIKILDPSCGSGIFLVESFNRLVRRYENAHQLKKLSDFRVLVQLLKKNIFGIEIHPQAIKVAAFSLYLALVDKLDPKNLWQDKNHQLPYLINDPEEDNPQKQGYNLFLRDTISDLSKENLLQDFKLVVGNPPFGELLSEDKDVDEKQKNIRNYCTQYNFAKEMVLPFLHKSTTFAPNGEIALIFNTKVLTNTGGTFQKFRKWLFTDCYVEKVFNFSILRNAKKDFGGQLFGDATGPISIVYFQKEQPEQASDKIVYYAPKTFIKSNVIDGLSIDFTDLKYLPREECQKSDTKIWKVAMWGGMNDWELIQRFDNSKFNTVKTFNKEKKIKSGVGFGLLTNVNDKPRYSEVLTNIKYLDADVITRYFTPENLLLDVKKSIKTTKALNFYRNFYNISSIDEVDKLTAFRRLGDLESFVQPHIVVKKGLEKNRVCSSFIEIPCSFKDGVYGFYTDSQNINVLYLLTSYFNSKLSSYYLFMTISSYGIEREQIMKNEYLSIPINLNEKQIESLANASKDIIGELKSKSFLSNDFDSQNLENYIFENVDKIIFESFNLTNNETTLISDGIKYSLDLFHKQEKSIALYPVIQEQIIEYGKLISAELNEFLDGQDLFANVTVYNVSQYSPLMMIKISHQPIKIDIQKSDEMIDSELSKIDQSLWEKKSQNIYFRKKLNYKNENDIYIIRPNQRRFWSQSMALEDASELILELLTEN
ncbi:adenine-specific methyltransferase activity Eco57IA [Aquipluma nitroreducens]|uniref:site-specific DNA-methyltransferase (adenine-specific) n=1 Tax=Aquipluma nitroreducens TaxID=2010828 RepID=A0A5K7S8U9_9BACT|nr:adenine-specific methyltransferase activity Eco57IA [Aquipluma nitroreducens]